MSLLKFDFSDIYSIYNTGHKYAYDGADRLTRVTDAYGNSYSYGYDDNENLVKQTGDKTVDYSYDKENHLVKATIQKGNSVTIESYTYDHAGNRLSKTVNESDTTLYVNDTTTDLTQVVAETDNNGNETAYYTRGDELLSMEKAGEICYYLYDGHGNVRTLTNEAGRITDRYSYDAYVCLLEKEGDTKNEFLYTGEQYNANTGLYYLRARYMNPSTGTFISMDSYQGSIYELVSLHKYLYANANPVKYSDPSGYYASLNETSIGQTINGILSRTLDVLNGADKVKKATLICNTLNISLKIPDFIFADNRDDKKDAAVSIIFSCVTIATVVYDVTFISSIFLGGAGIVNDIDGIISAVKNKDCFELLYNLGFLCLDVLSMGLEIDHHNFEIALQKSKILRSPEQKSLIELTKDTKFKEELTEGIKDVLFEWSKEYDSFEDVWNVLYHV